jgi:hypothetical protein
MQRTPLRLLSEIEDTEGNPKYDPGAKGVEFESAMARAFEILGLPADFNSQAAGGWDLTLNGKGWPQALGSGTKINLKIRSSKWMFSSKELTKLLPWKAQATIEEFVGAVRMKAKDRDALLSGGMSMVQAMKKYPAGAKTFLGRLAKKAKRSLHKQTRITSVRWTRPRTAAIQKAIVKAAKEEDHEALIELLSDKNFETFTLKELNPVLTVSIKRGEDRIGSVAYRDKAKKGRTGVGTPYVRSEHPREFGGDLRVGFRLERSAESSIDRVKHAFVSKKQADKLRSPVPF